MKTSACGDMTDEKLARQRAHENNIARYRGLLQTRLSDVERHFIDQRLAEEQAALSMLAQPNETTFVAP
ncbi:MULTISPECIES: hypothetical protein [unclassified Bradyrhizobium]|uniref:hypothetical protein n=1 Tax=unclassified Bradyrhizobium TaxID=2631580 RepID=UPI00247B1299|nr:MULTISPECIES: hypothetical protein [unclassified Bradyrhizobium]WGR96504.1 hypothetical protein MTX23_18710 [Bradyrhizobium sp. ISRA436]WGS03391.1 hypothetical protein MTX18_18710 [Bradyrhizobium sp. ISRA437]WGS10275.1 hypothetical protein MTX26_18710 [Bradyrhizobium sp. ISRA443]WGS17459.1 hypothetical protein MTX22_22690 [Bradyrhizobium sp. ISRA463]WGS24237.1 hypothetical protein MTX19_20355 [Bradyrhizobium sp. ISRA464]